MMTRWLVSIGTGSAQAPLIMAAQRLGYKVLGIDRAPDPVLIDNWIPISTHSTAAAVEAVVNHPLRPRFSAVLARTSGPALITAAEISDSLGLPGYGTALAKASLSKMELYQTACQLGVKAIESMSYSEPPPWVEGRHCVIKPERPQYGKKNVYCVASSSEYIEAFHFAASESLNNMVILQPYYPGRDIGLACMANFGELHWSVAYEELVELRNGQFRGQGVAGPVARLGDLIDRDLLPVAKRLAKYWGNTGFLFLTFRLTNTGKAYLYEANPGLCGDEIADQLFPALWPKFNFFELDVQLMSGACPTMPKLSTAKAVIRNGNLRYD